MLDRIQIQRIVERQGEEIILHEHMRIERTSYQHGSVTTFAHSIRVACLSIWLADRMHLWDTGSINAHWYVPRCSTTISCTTGMSGTTVRIVCMV